MSLHKFAEQVAAQGRGDDSLLVHMTPDEVRNLQQFAQANGTTLTINPTTGLPEAGLLSDLFKAVAPIALGAFLGPAGAAIGGGFMSAGMAGLATGGITALATGSLSRGLMAGLGAYGGAGLGESLMKAGTGALSQAAGAGLEQTAAEQAIGAKLASATPMETLTAGFNSATANPAAMGAFAKNNLSNIGMAAAPIMAGAMVPTTTKLGDPKDTGYIRQFDFNINPDTGKPDPLYGVRAMTPVKASEFGNKTFQGQRDLFRQQNPNPYELGVGSLNQPPQQQQQQQPTPMATGGIVALAGGGVSDADIFKYFQTPGLSDAQIAKDMQTFQVSAADIARATGTQDKQANYEQRFVNTLVSPTTDASEFQKATSAVGLQDQALATAMQNAGLSGGAQYALTQPAQNDIGFTGGIIDASTGKPVDLYNQIGYTAGALPGDQAGLEGLYGNINYVTSGLQNLINTGKMSVADAQNAALAELARTKVSVGDVKAATGKDFGNLFTPKKEDKKITPITTVTGTGGPSTTTLLPTNPTTNAPIGTTNPYGNVNNPGDLTFNNDGTVTVQPNIPGRPYGGFSGIQEIKDAYTKGGGSLGYTAKAPRTIDEFNQLYNKQTGDSLAAYDYLMGKGGGKYPAKSMASQIAVPYAEYALGKKTVGLKPITKTTGTSTATFKEPQTYFDEKAYLAANPDVEAEMKAGKSNFASAYEHYLRYGKAEGRKFAGDYDSYLAAVEADKARIANAANAANTGGTGADAGPAPGPDASSPANSDAGNDTAKTGGLMPRGYAIGGGLGSLGSYSDGGRLLKGPGDGVSDSIPATIGAKQQPARLADGEFVIPARIVSELGNGSTDAGAKKLYAMMDRVQRARGKTTGKNKVAANSRADKYLPA